MKRALKITSLVLALLLLAVGSLAAFVAIRGIPFYPHPSIQFPVHSTQASVAHGRKIARLLCVSCHFDSATGALTGKYMPDVPAQFGSIYGPNITQDRIYGIGSWTDEELAYLLRTGIRRDGRYEPPYMIKLPRAADEDISALIAFLHSDDPMVRATPVASHPSQPSFLMKALCYFAFKPIPYPNQRITAPDPADRVAFGRYLADSLLDCSGCHSADFQTNDPLTPERSKGFYGGGNSFRGAGGVAVQSSNITPDKATGIGSWNEAQFVNALRQGFRPDHSPLRYPMPLYIDLDDQEAKAIFAYLRTVPPLVNFHPRPLTKNGTGAAGSRLYEKYGCSGCHGESGDAPIDLRGATKKYQSDAELISFIKRPSDTLPTTQMPSFEGTIAEDEYAPLVWYVRTLQTTTQP